MLDQDHVICLSILVICLLDDVWISVQLVQILQQFWSKVCDWN